MEDLRDNLDEELTAEDIGRTISGFGKGRENLIPMLQAVQTRHSYISPVGMSLIARHLDLTVSEVHGVATFYNQFRFTPPGKHRIKICMGTACHVVGGEIILENFERKLGVKEGQTTADREYSIERVACVGCCALAPVAVVDDATHGHMAPSKVEGIMLGFEIEREREARERAESSE